LRERAEAGGRAGTGTGERVSGRARERIVQLGTERATHEREVCRWLLAAERLGVAARAGHGSLREYTERTIGLNGRQTEERLRVGRALTELPILDGAFARGELCFSAVRELTRVAVRRTEEAWRDWAHGQTIRQLEKAVASRRLGDRPDARPDPSRILHRLRFEVRAETMAMFRDLQAAVRADLGGDVGHIDDDMLLLEIARRALGGPGDDATGQPDRSSSGAPASDATRPEAVCRGWLPEPRLPRRTSPGSAERRRGSRAGAIGYHLRLASSRGPRWHLVHRRQRQQRFHRPTRRRHAVWREPAAWCHRRSSAVQRAGAPNDLNASLCAALRAT